MPLLQVSLPVEIDSARLEEFCRRWKIAELSAFGSVLRDDFRPGSDIDLLVSFAPDARVGLLEHATMEAELSELLGRKVDLVSRRAIERSANPLRRKAILENAVSLYVAG